MATTVNNSAWLEWMTALMGEGSRQSYAAIFPGDRFYCLLDDLPLHLIPKRARGLLSEKSHGPLFFNPQCSINSAGDIPEELCESRELFSGFALQGTIAWVRDGGAVWPFWLGPELAAQLRELNRAEAVPACFPANVQALLAAVNIFVPAGAAEDSNKQRRQMIQSATPVFRQRGYAPLGNLIHAFHVAALRRYFRHQIRSGAITLGDRQSSRRYVAHNEPVARFFHEQLTALLSEVAGEPLKPSYVYMASYLSGAELKKHTDREQCEFSITLCLDFSPEPALATPWPISLDTPNGNVTVYQALGDGLGYRGTRLPHYRAALPEGQMSTSIFFHYVRQDFAGSLT